MSVTASRLGQSPITLDWSNLARSPSPDPQAVAESWNKLLGRFKKNEVGFYDAPLNNELSQAAECETLARELLHRAPQITDCLFLGIGGSSLGPLSLLASLQDRRQNSIRFHFMENPDALDWSSTIRGLRPESTLVCVVAKSGTTFETLSQLLISLEWLGQSLYQSNLVAITDPAKGDLKAFATEHKIRTLHIAPSIGGRFSVFSPVGLFAAALAGLDLKSFIQGAKQVRDYVEKTPLEKNPLFILGSELIRQYSKRPIHVCMPYSTRLKSIGSWFVQLWGESLGKDGKGFTPLAAVGATDQHSILQLLRDGPDDKVTFFITVDSMGPEVKIPASSSFIRDLGKYSAFKLLQGHTLQELLRTEYRATSLVLTKQNRPNLTFQLDQLDERALGALYFTFAVLTAFTGTLWGVDPFDQPGVEEGKVYIRESLTQSRANAVAQAESDDQSPVARLRRDRE